MILKYGSLALILSRFKLIAENLMKQGLSHNYWNETIFQAYVNHNANVIYLQGLPEVSSSRPHHTDESKYALILPGSPLS
jgi:hypothetical protein